MTLIAITCQGDHADILTDSAAYTANLRHLTTTTKTYPLHHLDAALLFGGRADFGPWVRSGIELDNRVFAADFDGLVELLPDILPRMFAAYLAQTENPEDPNPAVVLVVGYSPAAGEFVAYEYGSDDGFAPTQIGGTYLHPTPWRLRPSQREYRLLLQAYEHLGAPAEVVTDIRDRWLTMPAPDPDITPDALVQLAREAREDRGMGGGIHIHGHLVHTVLRRGRVTTRTVHTFPTSGPDFEAFIAGTDHPQAQTADCYCGSGQPVLECCRAGDLDKPCRCYSGRVFRECCAVTATV